MCVSCNETPATAWVKFYSIWCIVLGLFCIIHGIFAIIVNLPYNDENLWLAIYLSGYISSSVSYIVAGSFLLISLNTHSRFHFRCGKITSYCFPIINWYYVFPLIVHFVCVPKLCRYMNE